MKTKKTHYTLISGSDCRLFGFRKLKRKALVDDIIYWIPKLIYYCIVVLIVMLMLITLIRTKVEMRDIEARVYANRILYTLDGISYQDDELGRVYPGMIDINRFKDEAIAASMNYSNPAEAENTYIAMNLSLVYQDRICDADANAAKGVNEEGREAVAYLNKKWYERFLPRVGKTGRGGALRLDEKRYVLVRCQDESLKPAILTITVLMPNE